MAEDKQKFGDVEVKDNGNDKGKEFYTSLDLGTREGKMLAFKAMSNPTLKNEALKNTAFEVKHIFKHSVKLEDEKTGEEVETDRIVLINEQGHTVAFVSGGAITSVENLIQIFGPAPWDPPIPVKLEEVNTRKGRRAYNLTPVLELM